MKQPTELEKSIADIFNEYFPEPVTGDLPGYEQAIQTLIDQEVKKARIDEIDRARAKTKPNVIYGTNQIQSAVADSYLVDRIAELEKDNK